MNHIFKLLLIAVAMVIAIPSFAVTDREMEAARTLAAKHYLRYANNGSDYLDKLEPSTMSELNAALKTKEKENIKSFNAVAVPKDYASWNKSQLVEYWSKTFFKSSGLKEDGKKCLGVLAKKLNKLTVSASAAPAAVEKPVNTPVAETVATPVATAAGNENVEPVASDAPASEITEDLTAVADADAGIADEQPRRSSNTIWYVAILVVLVGVVIWLVMYASKSMKESGVSVVDKKESEREIRDTKRAAKEEINNMREQYASSLAAKNDEIKQLKAKCESLEAQLEEAHRELSLAQSRLSASSSQSKSQTPTQTPKPATSASPAAETSNSKTTTLPPVVYLGYVNQRGLFVKASRSLNPDSSVYRMDIPDGHHGTYSVANASEVLDRVLSDIGLWLECGCVIENPQDADIATGILTLEPGEALFADNTCRVVKKARIKFI